MLALLGSSSSAIATPSSDLSKYFQPKRGCGLIFAARPIIPVWKAAWEKFYQPDDNLDIKFLVLHNQHGIGKWAADAADIENLRCIYPKGSLPEPTERLFRKIDDGKWIGSQRLLAMGKRYYYNTESSLIYSILPYVRPGAIYCKQEHYGSAIHSDLCGSHHNET